MEEHRGLEDAAVDEEEQRGRRWAAIIDWRLLRTLMADVGLRALAWSAPLMDWRLVGTIVAVFAADQVTKQVVKATLPLGASWPAEGLVRLTHGTNTGTAFGLLPNQTLFLIFASLVAIGFLVYFYRAYALEKPILRYAIGLQLGGAFGNLLDRVAFGRVTDFVDVGWWPIFNVADSAICVGMATLIVVIVLGDLRARRQGDAAQGGGG